MAAGTGAVAPLAGRGVGGRGIPGIPGNPGVEPGGDGSGTCASPIGTIGSGPPSGGGELDHALFFSPLYSGYDGVNVFQVPITVRGYVGIDWETDRPDLVDLEKVNDNTAMITTRGAGTARIIARAGSWRGSAPITITGFEPEERERGEALYSKQLLPPPPAGTFILPSDVSCRGCHDGGPDALSVKYTPQQTGGYSDEELSAIVSRGATPPRSNWFSGVPMQLYVMLHTWPEMTGADVRALVAYLRSLPPTPACR